MFWTLDIYGRNSLHSASFIYHCSWLHLIICFDHRYGLTCMKYLIRSLTRLCYVSKRPALKLLQANCVTRPSTLGKLKSCIPAVLLVWVAPILMSSISSVETITPRTLSPSANGSTQESAWSQGEAGDSQAGKRRKGKERQTEREYAGSRSDDDSRAGNIIAYPPTNDSEIETRRVEEVRRIAFCSCCRIIIVSM